MMTTAAEKVVVTAEKKEEKVEKRRALGRGLASLLPGPRVVSSPESRVPSPESTRDGDGANETKVPRLARDDGRAGTTASEEIEAKRAGIPALHRADAPYAAGQSEAAVPTFAPPVLPTSASPAVPTLSPSGSPASALNENEPGDVISIQAVAEERSAGNLVTNVPIELIDKNPYQTGFVFDEEQLQELQDSIRQHGVVQPVVVRPAEEQGRYILVLGERRLRASKMAGMKTIPALVRRLSPQQAAEMTVLENVVREDLNPIEQAQAFKVLSQEFKLTQSQIAQRIGVSRESVANYMRLLRLPEEVMEEVAWGRLSFSEARELLALENPEHILVVAREILMKHPTLDQLSLRVRMLNDDPEIPGTGEPRQGAARWVDPNVRAAQMEMERTLGMRVRIKDRNGKGKIVIEYASVDDYERVTTMLRGK